MNEEYQVKLSQVAKNLLRKWAKSCSEYVLHFSCQRKQVLLSRNNIFLACIKCSVSLLVLGANKCVGRV